MTGHGRGLATQKRRKSNASASGSTTRFACVKPGRQRRGRPVERSPRGSRRGLRRASSPTLCIVPPRARALGNRRRLRRGGGCQPAAVADLRADHDRRGRALRRLRGGGRLALAGLSAALRRARAPGGPRAGPRVPAHAAHRRVADRGRRRRPAHQRHLRRRARRPDPDRDRPAVHPQRRHEGRGRRAARAAAPAGHRARLGRASSPARRSRCRSARLATPTR